MEIIFPLRAVRRLRANIRFYFYESSHIFVFMLHVMLLRGGGGREKLVLGKACLCLSGT